VTSYRPVHEGWTISGADVSDLPATVPGCVHTALLAAGRIADPCRDADETAVAWIGRTDWEYATTFEGISAPRVDLVCDGLDTVATLSVNGSEIGQTANQHRSYRFDVGPVLRAGTNTLKIKFRSAYAYAEEQQQRLGARPNAYPEPFDFIRKQAANFGWACGPALVTAGVWQPIGLHAWSVARLAEVRPQVTVADGIGRVEVRVRLERASAGPVTIAARIGGRTATATIDGIEALLILAVDDPALWWPRGYGDQVLHDLEVTATGAGTTLDTWRRRVGFRTVRVDTAGDGFTLIVNDVPVFVRGVNWIPDDVFADRVTPHRLAARFRQAADANVNYLRVWGGGRYESSDFYSLADQMGFLVQQDFLFAGAAYPEEEPFASEIEAEARENVVRLSSHPSLVLWTGNNEDRGRKSAPGNRSWGAGYYFTLLPRIVAELDPTRFYWPGSPYSGSRARDSSAGTTHIWNADDYPKYGSYRPRFVAEFGIQGPPAYSTLRRAITDEPLGMAHPQQVAKLARGLANHLPAPVDFDDWHYLTQLNQARAVAYSIEHFRSLRPLCTGAIMWQLNDCWPVTSWAAIDSDGRKKPLWFALRDAYADHLLTLRPRPGEPLTPPGPVTPGELVAHPEAPTLIAVNDARQPWEFTATVTRRNLVGDILAGASFSAIVAPGEAQTLTLSAELTTAGDPSDEFLLAEADGRRTWWFFAEDKDIAWPRADFATQVETRGEVTELTVTARTILRSLTVFPDRLHPSAEGDRADLTLLPGESATITIRSDVPIDEKQLIERPVLRCVNDL
jgi:beta-mannosidase